MITLLVVVVSGLLPYFVLKLKEVRRRLGLVKALFTAKRVRIYFFVSPEVYENEYVHCEATPVYSIKEVNSIKRKRIYITETYVKPFKFY